MKIVIVEIVLDDEEEVCFKFKRNQKKGRDLFLLQKLDAKVGGKKEFVKA